MTTLPETPTTHVLESSDAAPPIVIVVFDELPLSSIQDATGNVNASRFPAFAALAQEGRFFTGLSTVAVQTDLALPALLTGRYHWRKFHGIVNAWGDSDDLACDESALKEMLEVI